MKNEGSKEEDKKRGDEEIHRMKETRKTTEGRRGVCERKDREGTERKRKMIG